MLAPEPVYPPKFAEAMLRGTIVFLYATFVLSGLLACMTGGAQ